MLLKKIKNPFRRKTPNMPSKGYNTLTEAIKKTPEYTTKEVAIVKVENEYYNISKSREKNRAIIDEKLLKKAFKHKKSKIVHTHTIGPLKELPSANDISVLFFEHFKYKKNFTAISNIDRKTGEISGAIGVLFTTKTITFIENNFFIPKTRDVSILQRNIYEAILKEQSAAKTRAQDIANFQKNKTGKTFIETYNKELKRIMFDYYQNVLGLKIRFVPNTTKGYRFNKERMAFERI